MLKFLNFLRNRIKSFGYAFNGIWYVIISQINFRIHLFIAIVVIFFAVFFHISTTEWLILIMTIFFVLIAETFNTAIEKLVDLVSPQYHHLAGLVKDIAAGAVLLSAIMAVIIGLIIFLPKFCSFLY